MTSGRPPLEHWSWSFFAFVDACVASLVGFVLVGLGCMLEVCGGADGLQIVAFTSDDDEKSEAVAAECCVRFSLGDIWTWIYVECCVGLGSDVAAWGRSPGRYAPLALTASRSSVVGGKINLVKRSSVGVVVR